MTSSANEIRRRLVAPCGKLTFPNNREHYVLDTAALIRHLLLFDTYILRSAALREIPYLLEFLGYDGLIEMLSSGAMQIYTNAPVFASTGQSPIFKERIEKGILPPGSFGVAHLVHGPNAIHNLGINLQYLNESLGLDRPKMNKLEDAIVSVWVNPSATLAGTKKIIADHRTEVLYNPKAFKTAIWMALKKDANLDAFGTDFSISMEPLDDGDYRMSDTNMGQVFGIDTATLLKVVERALLGIGGALQRLSEMETFSALCGSLEEDAPFFRAKLNVLHELICPDQADVKFQKVLALKGFPSFRFDQQNLKVDVRKLLELREDAKLMEFRQWLSSLAESTDEQIEYHMNGLRTQLARCFHNRATRVIRLIATQLGPQMLKALPGGLGAFSDAAGVAVSSVDQFLAEKVLPRSGPVIFLDQICDSIFGNR